MIQRDLEGIQINSYTHIGQAVIKLTVGKGAVEIMIFLALVAVRGHWCSLVI
jgi:hypothetical protein